MMTTLREDAKSSQSSIKMKNCPRYGCRRPAAIQAQNVPLVWPHSSTPLFRIQIAIDKGKTRLPIKKRTPIKALKVLNDQRPQVLPSGQNIHVRFACLYHTMIHA